MSSVKWKLKEGVTWRDKLVEEHPNHGKLVKPNAAQRRQGFRTVLIARPLDVDAAVRSVRKGELITVKRLRERLAKDAGADTTCPLTTGIFLRIVAEAAEEAARAGKKRITPWWRVVDNNGGLRPRSPGGVREHAKRLRAEGFSIAPARGKQPPKVRRYREALA